MDDNNKKKRLLRYYKPGKMRCFVPMCPNIFGYFAKVYHIKRRHTLTKGMWIEAIRASNELWDICFPPGLELPYCAGVCALHFEDKLIGKDRVKFYSVPTKLLKLNDIYEYMQSLQQHPELSDGNESQASVGADFDTIAIVDSDDDDRQCDDEEPQCDDDERRCDGEEQVECKEEPNELVVVNEPVGDDVDEEEDSAILIDDDDYQTSSKLEDGKLSFGAATELLDFESEKIETVQILDRIVSECVKKRQARQKALEPELELMLYSDSTGVIEILSDDDEPPTKKSRTANNKGKKYKKRSHPNTKAWKRRQRSNEAYKNKTPSFPPDEPFPPYLFRLPPAHTKPSATPTYQVQNGEIVQTYFSSEPPSLVPISISRVESLAPEEIQVIDDDDDSNSESILPDGGILTEIPTMIATEENILPNDELIDLQEVTKTEDDDGQVNTAENGDELDGVHEIGPIKDDDSDGELPPMAEAVYGDGCETDSKPEVANLVEEAPTGYYTAEDGSTFEISYLE